MVAGVVCWSVTNVCAITCCLPHHLCANPPGCSVLQLLVARFVCWLVTIAHIPCSCTAITLAHWPLIAGCSLPRVKCHAMHAKLCHAILCCAMLCISRCRKQRTYGLLGASIGPLRVFAEECVLQGWPWVGCWWLGLFMVGHVHAILIMVVAYALITATSGKPGLSCTCWSMGVSAGHSLALCAH